MTHRANVSGKKRKAKAKEDAAVEAVAHALKKSPAFADLMSPPDKCARELAQAALAVLRKMGWREGE